jgi:hypothetical protein
MIEVTKRFIDVLEKKLFLSERIKLADSLRDVHDWAKSGHETALLSRSKLDRLHGRLGEVADRLGLGDTFEWKPSLKQRLVFTREGERIRFVDYDPDHTAVEGLESQGNTQLASIFNNEVKLPAWLETLLDGERNSVTVSPLLLGEGAGGSHRDTYAEALDNNWLKFLDDPQQELLEQIESAVLRNQDTFSVHMIIGGAGTGKTMVLLQLAWRLRHKHNLQVILNLPKGLKEQLKYTQSIDWYEPGISGVHLLDDPLVFENVTRLLESAKAQSRPLVFAIDPTQWEDKKVREKFAVFLKKTELTEYTLLKSYRQGGLIGQEVKKLATHFLKHSSYRADVGLVREQIESANYWETVCLTKMTFSDELGFFKIYNTLNSDEYTPALDEIFSRALQYENYRSNWPRVLVASDVSIPKEIEAFLKDVQQKMRPPTRLRHYQEAYAVRGTEFENVVLIMRQKDWSLLQKGKTGLSAPEWEKCLSMLTFMSRAENQLALVITA